MNTPGSFEDGTPAASLGERGLIERIRRRLPAAPSSLVVGPGDDAAVVSADRGSLLVLTTDALVQGVHFDFRFSSPSDIGYKALAVNVSDVAAMGAAPRFALLSLMLPDGCPLSTVDGLLDGLLDMAAASGVTVAGGNISRSPGPLVVDVALTGSVRPRRVLTRAGGSPGARLFVTGTIGAAAAGLGYLRAHPDGGAIAPHDPLAACVNRHRRPEPRARIGALLGRSRAAAACMDLSDGLADALRQVAEASGTGVKVEAERLPIDPAAAEWFTRAGADPVTEALKGGDDYELLFAVPPRRNGRLRHVLRETRGVPVTHIGELTAAPTVTLVRGGVEEPLPTGFTHF